MVLTVESFIDIYYNLVKHLIKVELNFDRIEKAMSEI